MSQPYSGTEYYVQETFNDLLSANKRNYHQATRVFASNINFGDMFSYEKFEIALGGFSAWLEDQAQEAWEEHIREGEWFGYNNMEEEV
jgi:hypothetical protein